MQVASISSWMQLDPNLFRLEEFRVSDVMLSNLFWTLPGQLEAEPSADYSTLSHLPWFSTITIQRFEDDGRGEGR
jgi:hypothetical protein